MWRRKPPLQLDGYQGVVLWQQVLVQGRHLRGTHEAVDVGSCAQIRLRNHRRQTYQNVGPRAPLWQPDICGAQVEHVHHVPQRLDLPLDGGELGENRRHIFENNKYRPLRP